MGLVFASPLLVAGLALVAEPSMRWLMLGVAGAVLVGMVLVLLPCRYGIVEDAVVVRCGIFRWRLALRDIREVELSDSWMSGPALSLRRIRIEMNNGYEILISPVDREGFLAEVRARRAEVAPKGL